MSRMSQIHRNSQSTKTTMANKKDRNLLTADVRDSTVPAKGLTTACVAVGNLEATPLPAIDRAKVDNMVKERLFSLCVL